MKRADHPKLKDGVCTLVVSKTCPPGFWMTAREIERWAAMVPDARRAYEQAMNTEKP